MDSRFIPSSSISGSISFLVDPPDEQAAQAQLFAFSLLMPKELVERAYTETRNVFQLARNFNVPKDAMEFRLDALNLT